ncbi:DUF6325 family protein [Gordonia terrae]
MTTELGPVDYVVVELPTGASSVDGDVCAELTGLVDNHLVRVLDLLLITRGADGTVSVAEFEDMTRDGLGSLAGSLVELLSLEDIENLATTIAPGLSGLAIVWEYTCTEPFFSAVDSAGAQLTAVGRIPARAIVASLRGHSEQP